MSANTRTVEIKLPTTPSTKQKVNIPKNESYIVYITICGVCEDIKAIGSKGKLQAKCDKCNVTLMTLDWIVFRDGVHYIENIN